MAKKDKKQKKDKKKNKKKSKVKIIFTPSKKWIKLLNQNKEEVTSVAEQKSDTIEVPLKPVSIGIYFTRQATGLETVSVFFIIFLFAFFSFIFKIYFIKFISIKK